jgi:WD40 repeat protein
MMKNIYSGSLSSLRDYIGKFRVPGVSPRATIFHRCAVVGALACMGYSAHAQDEKITYDDHIKPLFQANCFKCHSQEKTKADLDLSTYQGVLAGGSSGASVVAGNPDKSFLYGTMTHAEEPFMPEKSPKRPQAELDLVKKWIAGGLLESKSSVAMKPKKPSIDLKLASAPTGKPEGPPPMPVDMLLEPVVLSERSNALTALATSPWAPLLAVAGQQQVLLYHTENQQMLGVLPFPEGIAYALAFSRNGKLLLAGGGKEGSSGKVVVWNVENGQRVIELGDDYDVIFGADISGDQAYVATGGADKFLKIYSTSTLEQVHRIKKHTEWITAISYSPDAVLLASADRNGNLYVWESETAQQFYELRGHKAGITSVSWRSDANVLASASEDGTIKLWNMHDGKEIKSWTAHAGGVASVRYSMDGRLVSSGRDKHVKIWNGEGAVQKDIGGFTDLTLAGVFSHDNQRVISGDWTGFAKIWKTDDGAHLGDLQANPPPIKERITGIEGAIAGKKAEAEKQVNDANALAATVKQMGDGFNQKKGAYDGLVAQKVAVDKELTDAQAALASLPKPEDPKPFQDKVNATTAARQQAEQQLNEAKKHLQPATDKLNRWKRPQIDAAELAAADKGLAEAPNDEEKAKRQAHLAEVKKGKVDQESMTLAQNQFNQVQGDVNGKNDAFNKANADLDVANKEMAAVQQRIVERTAAMTAGNQKVQEIDAKVKAVAGQMPPAQQALAAAEKAMNEARPKADEARKVADAAQHNANGLVKELAFWKAAEFNIQVVKTRESLHSTEREKEAQQQAAIAAQQAAERAAAEAVQQQQKLDQLKVEYEKLKAAAQ